MGYCMNLCECDFFIEAKNKKKALKGLKELAKKEKNLSWVCNDVIIESMDLEEALEEIRFEAELDEKKNVVGLDFTGEKLGQETKIFNAMAQFVKAGSYIQMYGEDGDKWRWVFDGKECKWVNPILTWPE